MRRTKILATLGPASLQEETIRQLIQSGANAVRLNFSHGTADQHRRTFETVRRVAAQLSTPVAVLQDLQGPKIRVGRLPCAGVTLVANTEVTVVHAAQSDSPDVIPCSYEPIAREVRQGDPILLDDGRLRLLVLETDNKRARCLVEIGGPLTDHKGINLPGAKLTTPALTAKDHQDLQLGRELGVDYVALSFVRSPGDVEQARDLAGGAGLVAKIEKPEALDCIEAIIDLSAGIMVARGDLGVEMGPERVPMVQKTLIDQANARGKLVITATEMLETMRTSNRPTRAEVSDVANAVLDGTDVVMLSGETAVGAFPVESVRTMHRIVCETETSDQYQKRVARPPESLQHRESTSAVARASVVAAQEVGADAILCFTESGYLPSLLSDYRPVARIIAATEHLQVYNRLALLWGVEPLLLNAVLPTAEATIEAVKEAAIAASLVHKGQRVIVAAGQRAGGPSDIVKIDCA